MILTALMAHQRKLIRHAVVEQLIAANTAAGARVLGTRVEPTKKSQLPTISVYTLGEETDMELSEQSAPRELTRDLVLEIAAWVAHSDTYPADDAMDDIAEQIEASMDADRYIGVPPANTAAESILTGCVMTVLEEDGKSDPLLGLVTLTYKVTYRTRPSVTGGNVQDLDTVGITTVPPNGVSDTVPLTDVVTEAQ